MQQLRAEVLKEHLRQERFGTIVRANLSPTNASRIRRLKELSGRYYKDIFRVLLSVYRQYPEHFPITKQPKRPKIVTFRLSRELALFSSDWAWERGEKRAYFFNSVIQGFFEKVPMKEAAAAFENQEDRVARILRR